MNLYSFKSERKLLWNKLHLEVLIGPDTDVLGIKSPTCASFLLKCTTYWRLLVQVPISRDLKAQVSSLPWSYRTNWRPRGQTHVTMVLMVGGLGGHSTGAWNRSQTLSLGWKSKRVKRFSEKFRDTRTLFWGSLWDDIWLVKWELSRGLRLPALQKCSIKLLSACVNFS